MVESHTTFQVDDLGVPDVVGLTPAVATEILAAALFFEVGFDGTPDGDLVTAQNPPAFTVVDPTLPVILTLFTATVTAEVRATAAGYYGGLYRQIGDLFNIIAPEEFSPYWMTFTGIPPTDWVASLAVFDPYIDREMLEFGLPV